MVLIRISNKERRLKMDFFWRFELGVYRVELSNEI